MLTFGSLFAGIGGIDLGLERAGMKCKWQVEIDPWCQKVLAKHWPDVERFADVREVGAHNLAPVDVIAGGFPCQPVSRAGRTLRQRDERWLWPDFYRVVRELRPRYVFVENVPGLMDGGLDEVLGDLAASGFDADWSVLSACAVGAPHTRQRVFIVADAHGGDGTARLGPVTHGASPLQPVHYGKSPQTHSERWFMDAPSRDGGVAHGLSRRLDRPRIKALGNAVVPQAIEFIGRRIAEAEEARLVA